MPRGHKRRTIRAVSDRLRLFVAALMAQFTAKPEELLQRAEATLSATTATEKDSVMADDRLNRGQPDRSKINMHEDYEVRYWTRHLGTTREELQRVVDRVGNSARAVAKEFGKDAA